MPDEFTIKIELPEYETKTVCIPKEDPRDWREFSERVERETSGWEVTATMNSLETDRAVFLFLRRRKK